MGRSRNLMVLGVIALALGLVAPDRALGRVAGAMSDERPDPSLGDRAHLEQVLDRPRHGSDALARLNAGRHVEAVAAVAGWTPRRLRSVLGSEDDLYVRPDGLMFYADAESELGTSVDAAPAFAAATAGGDAETFALHSLAGSSKVMYLDFVGFANATTAETWTAFDLDGDRPCPVGTADPACFTSGELAMIREVWARVAEAYAAFDVDVTTEDPGTAAIYRSEAADTQYGARLILGAGDGDLAASCTSTSCLGVAWVGQFASSSASVDPLGFVRIPSFGASPSPSDVGGTAVHELGHTVGLGHTGAEASDGLWAPWMRASSFTDGSGAPLEQFTETGPEDEYAVMAGYGLMPRADESSPGIESSLSFAASGVISSPADQDSFAFTVPPGAAATTTTVVPAPHSSLDVVATLLDSTMMPIASSDPPASRVDFDTASGLDASIVIALAPGDYTLVVDGTGLAGQYSDYGSIGSYAVTVATTVPNVSVGSASVVEGDAGSPRNVTFPVVLWAASTSTVTVDYAIGTVAAANAATLCASTVGCALGSGGDVRSRTGTLRFVPSATTGLTPTVKYVTASVYPDADVEGDEVFGVVLSNPTGVALGRSVGFGTIVDDDPVGAAPQVSIGSASIPEGDAGVTATKANRAKLWVTLSAPATGIVTVKVTITPDDATPGTDFGFGSVRAVFPVTKTITFAAGQWKKPVTIGVFPDTSVEGDETVTATLSDPTGGAVLGRTTATFTILNDD